MLLSILSIIDQVSQIERQFRRWQTEKSAGAPPYEPYEWNELGVREVNNCYAYATNCKTGKFVNPGGLVFLDTKMINEVLTGDLVKSGAILDGLKEVEVIDANFPELLEGGHLVALVVSPGMNEQDSISSSLIQL